MAEHTANYNLEKQQGNEFVSIEGINGNFDIIDTEIKVAQDKADQALEVAGDAQTVNGHTVESDVPANAKFTDTIYIHPTTHSPGIIAQDANNRFVTDAEKASWNGKAAGTHTHTKSQITDFPASFPANGGNSDTVDGVHIQVQTTTPSSLSNNILCIVYE